MATFKKVMGVSVLALLLAACSSGYGYHQDGRYYGDGDRTFHRGQVK